ncbi:recombinase family protein [Streptomyces sp. Ag109_O5-10]|uniref:recombinase family protein n=1 Tax=Streptomyces sp. Ag109_O5-10 TaxID=1855349 RepID=UPI000B834723|nr:recombinase family protein [Streptomyces sp. Ag109_O5-10]
MPWQRRPRANELLQALRNPNRGFDAVVIGEPQRTFYGNQFGNTFPVFVHFRIPLWVPEIGGPIDPDNEAHDLVMSVFGGMSRGERNRIKIRVRTAMSSQAQLKGRYLGGRPPYGYRITDAGPHPNPSKAAVGQRIHKLEPDPAAAPVVQRIFRLYIDGMSDEAIAAQLTRDGIPCPSAHDAARYQAALEAGADPAVVTQWINAAQQDKEAAQKKLDALPALARKKQPPLNAQQIREITDSLGGIAQRIRTADVHKKGSLYEGLGITISYEHAKRTATVRSRPSSPYRQWLCPRGDLNPHAR